MMQKELIMDYMRVHGSITPMEAFSDLGITKLATVISKMIRKDGIKIVKTPVASVSRYGRPCHYMKYSLEDVNG